MSRSMDFICALSASSFSSAVAIREVRVGGLGLRASEWVALDGGGGGSTGSWKSMGKRQWRIDWGGRKMDRPGGKLIGAVESARMEVG